MLVGSVAHHSTSLAHAGTLPFNALCIPSTVASNSLSELNTANRATALLPERFIADSTSSRHFTSKHAKLMCDSSTNHGLTAPLTPALSLNKLSLANLNNSDLRSVNSPVSTGRSLGHLKLGSLTQTLTLSHNSPASTSSLSNLAHSHLMSKSSRIRSCSDAKGPLATPLTQPLPLHIPSVKLDLLSALKTKQRPLTCLEVDMPGVPMETGESPLDSEPTASQSLELFKFEQTVRGTLVPQTISRLGQILCSSSASTYETGTRANDNWSYHAQLGIVHPSLHSHHHAQQHSKQPVPIHRFNFLSPSPDDVVLSKQRGAFTRSGESKLLVVLVAGNFNSL